MANNEKAKPKKKMLAAVSTKMRCSVCNDKVSKYVDLVTDKVESWFCNDWKCKHGLRNMSYSEEKPAWVKEVTLSVDSREL